MDSPPNSPSNPFRVLPAIAITIVVILIIVGIAWYGKLVSFVPAQETIPPNQTTQTQNVTPSMELSVGTYALVGKGAGQAENYAGTVTITKRGTTNNIYDLVWRITSGQAQLGVGILTDDILSVSYYEAPDGSLADVGVVSYKVVDSSHLEGEWTSVVGGSAGFEQLSLQPQL